MLERISVEKINRHLILYINKIINFFYHTRNPKIVFVLGYGRSGTSILINLLGHVFFLDAHGERSKHFMKDFLIDFDLFDQYIKSKPLPIIATKPILNSFSASILLDRYPDSRIIWMFRDYKSVTSSAIKKFGGNVAVLMKDSVTGGAPNWISTQIPKEAVDIIKKQPYSTFSDLDWTALVWWSVNFSLFLNNLDKSPRVHVVDYDHLTTRPGQILVDIFHFLDIDYNNVEKYIDASNSSASSEISLCNEVANLCNEMLFKLRSLDNTYSQSTSDNSKN